MAIDKQIIKGIIDKGIADGLGEDQIRQAAQRYIQKASFVGPVRSTEGTPFEKEVASLRGEYDPRNRTTLDKIFLNQPRPKTQGFAGAVYGAQKSIGGTVAGIGQLLGFKLSDEGRAYFQREGTQKIGGAVTDIAQFMIPAGKITAGGKAAQKAITGGQIFGTGAGRTAAGIGARAAVEGLGSAATAKLTGGSNQESLTTGAFAAGLTGGSGLLGAFAANFSKLVSSGALDKKQMASKLMNSVIKPSQNDLKFGRDPGLAMAEAGIVGRNIDELLANTKAITKTIGKQIGEATKGVNVKVNVKPTITSYLDDAIKSAADDGEDAFVKRLQALKKSLTQEYSAASGGFTDKSKNLTLSIAEVNQLKQKIGKASKWYGQAFDGEVNQVRRGLYQLLDEIVEKNVPQIKQLNKQYSNLITAENALDKVAKQAKRKDLLGGLGLKDMIAAAGWGGSVELVSDSPITSLGTGFTVLGLLSALKNPGVASKLATYLATLSKSQRKALVRQYPSLQPIIARLIAGVQEETAEQPADQGYEGLSPNEQSYPTYQQAEYASNDPVGPSL